MVSDCVPFTLCPISGEAKAVSPKLVHDEIYLPDSRTEGWSVKLPWMVEECILKHLATKLVRAREFEDGAGVMCLTKRLLWYWADKFGLGQWRTVRQQSRGVSRAMFLLNEINERAIDLPVMKKRKFGWPGLSAAMMPGTYEDLMDQQLMTSQEEEAGMLSPFHFPVLNVENPFWYHVRSEDRIMPWSLAGRGAHGLDVDMSVTGYMDGIVVFSDFQKASATGGWVGRRLCDLMLIDADAEHGVFYAAQVVFPVILLSVKAPQGDAPQAGSQTTGAWEGAMREWVAFAELLELAFDGCGLYIEKPDLPEGQWGCRYFQRVGKDVPPDVKKSNAW